MTRIFLVGFYGADNLGDDAIRESIERAANELGARIGNYAVRTEPDNRSRAVRLRGPGWRRYLRAIWSADRIVIGGGGLLKDQGGYGILLELLATAVFARLLGKSVALVGIGVGPLYTRLGARLTSPIARLASQRLVRDRASAEVLAGLGVSGVEVYADPVFSMRNTMIAGNQQAKARLWPPRRMLISARSWYLLSPDGPERWSQLVVAIASMADEAIEAGIEIRFACLWWPKDRVAAEEILAKMRHGAQVTGPSTPTDWWGLADDLRESDVLVAMRYHAIVCAALTNTPVFALAYEPKVVSLVQDLGGPMLDINDQMQVTAISTAVRAFHEAASPTPTPAVVEQRAAEMSASAWQGLTRALTV